MLSLSGRYGRVLLAALIGAGLAVSGAALQGLFRNPLADPFVIGASSGAALGATLAIVTGVGPVSLAAFAGSLLAVAAAYSIAENGRKVHRQPCSWLGQPEYLPECHRFFSDAVQRAEHLRRPELATREIVRAELAAVRACPTWGRSCRTVGVSPAT